MAFVPDVFELSGAELREVTRFAVACATPALAIFESVRPGDGRPRAAVAVASVFASGERRTKALRDNAWAAQRAAREACDPAARDAALAAMAAAGAAFLHPLPKATQVKHILGSAAHAARAFEISAGENRILGALDHATPVVAGVLARYPAAPGGGGRVGELIRQLDSALRAAHSTDTAELWRPDVE